MLLDSLILSPRHLCPNQAPSIERIMGCKCDAAQAAGKAIEEFVNFHRKMLLPSVDFFRLCHRTVMLNTPSCVFNLESFMLKSLRPGIKTADYWIPSPSLLSWAFTKRHSGNPELPLGFIHRCWAGVCNLTAIAIKVLLSHLVLFAKEQQRSCSTASSPICCVWMVVSCLQT